MKLARPSECMRGGVELRTVEGASVLAARACVRKGPATDEVVPAEIEPILIYESETLDMPLFILSVSLTN